MYFSIVIYSIYKKIEEEYAEISNEVANYNQPTDEIPNYIDSQPAATPNNITYNVLIYNEAPRRNQSGYQ